MARGRPKSKLTREQKLEKKRDAERERRARRKADPELQEEDRIKETLRNSKRKKDEKIKLVADLTPRELRIRRKKIRENVRKFRMRRQNLARVTENTPPTSPQNEDVPVALSHPGSSRREAGKRRKRRHDRKTQRENIKLREQLKTARRNEEKQRKRYQRLLKKISLQNLLSPKSKARHMVNNRNDEKTKKEIEERLVFGEVVKRQICSSFSKTKEKKSHRQLFSKLVGGDILKKYRWLTKAGDFFSYKTYRANQRRNCLTLKYERALKKSTLKRQKQVKEFLLDDEQSTLCPGKKQFKIIKGKKFQMRYLNNTMTALYRRFKSKMNFPLSFATFCRFKPRNLVKPKLEGRDSCLCVKHENIKLLTSQLHRAGVIASPRPEDLIKDLGCEAIGENCFLRKCQACSGNVVSFLQFDNSTEFSHKMWVTISEKREIKGQTKFVKRIVKEQVRSTLRKSCKKLEHDLIDFMRHVHAIQHQHGILRVLKQRPGNEISIHIDFSKNYACKHFAEPQAMHFGASRLQLSLHTGVAYCDGLKASFCTVSSNLRHNAKAILAHLVPTLQFLLERFNNTSIVNTLHFISDGPTAQYRNRTMFTAIGKFIPQFFPNISNITWNYSEAGHGKGPADGIGGALKRTEDRIVSHGNDISDLDSFVHALSHEDSNIKLMVINNNDIEEIDKVVLPSTLIATVPNTMKVHQCTWNKNVSTLYFNSLSCTECAIGMECTHYSLRTHRVVKVQPSLTLPGKLQPTQGVRPSTSGARHKIFQEANPTPVSRPLTPESLFGSLALPLDTQPSAKKAFSRANRAPSFQHRSIEEGTWVAVMYEKDWYPGIVEKVRGETLLVNFMARTGANKFFWPDIADRQEVDREGVLYVMKSPPQPISNRHMTVEEAKYIDFLSRNSFPV